MPGSQYRLYGRRGAGSLAPQMLLEEIGAAYELVWVSKAPAEIEAFRRISPAAKIPALMLQDGTMVSESAAILIHLTNAHPAAGLAPTLTFCSGWFSCRQTRMKQLCGSLTRTAIQPTARLRQRRSRRKPW